MASLFAPLPSADLGVATEISRMQAVIDSLQSELARLRGSSAVGAGQRRRIDVRVATCKKTGLEGGGSMQFLVLTSGAGASGRDGS